MKVANGRDELRIFLSHSGQDGKMARSLASEIEAAVRHEFSNRVEVFNTSEPEYRFAEWNEQASPGEDFTARSLQYERELRAYLRKQLWNSAAYLLLITQNALQDASQWVQWEATEAAGLAEELDVPFVPCYPGVPGDIQIDDFLPAEVWQLQGVFLGEPEGLSPLVNALRPGIARAVDRAREREPTAWTSEPTVQLEAVQVLPHPSTVREIAFSTDGNLLATTSRDNLARLWDVGTGLLLAELPHRARVLGVSFSPDGRLLATTGHDQLVRLWNAATGEPLAQPPLRHDGPVWRAAFSPDTRLLATTSLNKAQLWDVATGQKRTQLQENDKLLGVKFSPDGAVLATTSRNKRISLWSVPTGQRLSQLHFGRHESPVWEAAFSPDAVMLATTDLEGTPRIWDVPTGTPVSEFPHPGRVLGVAFSHNGRLLATTSDDHMGRLWEIATGLLHAGLAHDGPVWGAAFSPDDRLLATTSDDQTARVWMTLED